LSSQHVVVDVLVVHDPLPGLAPLDHQLDQVLALKKAKGNGKKQNKKIRHRRTDRENMMRE
jgi:hypothetical protein